MEGVPRRREVHWWVPSCGCGQVLAQPQSACKQNEKSEAGDPDNLRSSCSESWEVLRNTQSHPRFSSANHTFREWREHSECLERSWGFPAYLGEAYWNDFVICSVIVSSDPGEPDISGRLQRSRCRVGEV